MWRINPAVVLLLALITSACTPSSDSASSGELPTLQTISVAITPALSPLRDALRICGQSYPDTVLFVNETPTGALDLDEADLSFRLGEPEELPVFSAPIAWEEIVVVVHPSNSITALSNAQLQAIFGGRVKTWEEGSGSGEEIHIWIGIEGDEVRQIFDDQVLRNFPITPTAKLAPSPQAMLEEISADPGAVGYLPRAWLTTDVRSISTNVRHPVLAISSKEPQGATRTLLFCLQSEAIQQILGTRYISLGEQ